MQEARVLYYKLLRYQSDDPVFLNQLGGVAYRLGEKDVALELLKKVVTLRPEAPFYNNLALMQEENGALEDAHQSYLQALKIDPSFAEAHNTLLSLGRIMQKDGNYVEGLKFLQKAYDLAPSNPDVVKQFAYFLMRLGNVNKGIDICKKALTLNGPRENLYVFLGEAYAALGNKKEALNYYYEALRISPDKSLIYLMIAMIKKFESGARDIEEMERICQGLSGIEQSHLCFALGKAYEDTAEYAKAFQFIEKGNAIVRETYSYESDNDRNFFAKVKSTFNPEFLQQENRDASEDLSPFFVVGMPRSGTSLVEQILASHPDVFGAGELYALDLIIREKLRENRLGNFPGGFSRMQSGDMRSIGFEYIAQTRKNYHITTKHFVDKMPNNFLFIGLIHIALPNARIIHCKRDPMDTCWSIYKNIFEVPHKYAQNLEELGAYYLLYRDLMNYWNEQLPGRIFEIEYEKIIANQEEETRKLLQYCKLDWDRRCLEFHKAERPVLTASKSQVRQPLYGSSVKKWRFYEKQLQPLRNILQDSGGTG